MKPEVVYTKSAPKTGFSEGAGVSIFTRQLRSKEPAKSQDLRSGLMRTVTRSTLNFLST
jgi:hypothetical protein